MDSITHLIKTGLLKDLQIAERSFRLNKKINDLKNEIPSGSKMNVSQMLYDLTYTEMVLSLGRLYDEPDKRYPNICLKQLYKLVKDANFKLNTKESAKNILFQLRDSEWCSEPIEIKEESDTTAFNRNAILYFELVEINDPVSSSILKIKEIRDKFLAHTEDINIEKFIPYDTVNILINHAKDILSFFSLAYSGIHLRTATGKFYLSHSTSNWEINYASFIKEISH